jgi:hypothetical protein
LKGEISKKKLQGGKAKLADLAGGKDLLTQFYKIKDLDVTKKKGQSVTNKSDKRHVV